MDRIPLMCKTDYQKKVLSLSTRTDKLGNILHCVEYPDNSTDSGTNYAMFTYLSSALDFISTNFK